MVPTPPEHQRLTVVRKFLPAGTEIHSITPVDGGFSGAHIDCLQTSAGRFALRCWLRNQIPAERLQELHSWLAHLQQAGIPVAVPLRTPSFESTLSLDDVSFQCEPWLPGKSASRDEMTPPRWRALMHLLGRMHHTSTKYLPTPDGAPWFQSGNGVAPAIPQRCQILQGWTPTKIVQTRYHLAQHSSEFSEIATKILAEFLCHAPKITEELQQAESLIVPLSPCLRDLWGEHVLFDGDEVSGLIDPAAARTDHVSSDLSRLLGSLLGDDFDGWQQALREYQQVRPLTPEDLQLLRVMDRSSVLLSGMVWIDRWRADSLPANQLPRLLPRLNTIHARMQNLSR